MADGIHKYTVQESQNLGLGQAGAIFVTSTDEVTCKNGVFVAITFLEDTKFNDTAGLEAESSQMWPDATGTGTDISTSGGDDSDSETFPKGITIYGRWTAFTLSSGKVIAYRG